MGFMIQISYSRNKYQRGLCSKRWLSIVVSQVQCVMWGCWCCPVRALGSSSYVGVGLEDVSNRLVSFAVLHAGSDPTSWDQVSMCSVDPGPFEPVRVWCTNLLEGRLLLGGLGRHGGDVLRCLWAVEQRAHLPSRRMDGCPPTISGPAVFSPRPEICQIFQN